MCVYQLICTCKTPVEKLSQLKERERDEKVTFRIQEHTADKLGTLQVREDFQEEVSSSLSLEGEGEKGKEGGGEVRGG